jgi:hypothetical protein
VVVYYLGIMMSLRLRNAWKSVWRTLRVIAAFVVIWVLAGVAFGDRITNWETGWILLTACAIAGFWGSLKRGSVLEVLLGVVLSVFVVVLVMIADISSLQPTMTMREIVVGSIYIAVGCVAVAAIGYYLGSFVLARKHRAGS